MGEKKKVLFAGESCVVHSVEFKGYDNFFGTRYNESALTIKKIIENEGYEFTHIPCHLIPFSFPASKEMLSQYDVVIISDVGSNTFLLHPETVRFSKRMPNLLKVIKEYVADGGGFVMIGGYMTFQGIDAKARYSGTVIEEILPVDIYPYDDRVEVPEGADIINKGINHPILDGLPEKWPYILGYNKLIPKQSGEVLISYEGDPIITAGTYENGRTVAFATDCMPHWAPPEMLEWEYYGKLWDNILSWVSGKDK